MYGAGESSAASWLGSLPKGLEGLPVNSVKARELSRSAYHALGKLCGSLGDDDDEDQRTCARMPSPTQLTLDASTDTCLCVAARI